eukprot:3469700-Rhodomonas_salina.1
MRGTELACRFSPCACCTTRGTDLAKVRTVLSVAPYAPDLVYGAARCGRMAPTNGVSRAGAIRYASTGHRIARA